MNPNNNVDLSSGLSYNEGNDIYDAVAEHYLNQPLLVKMDEQKAINDTACRHETLVADPEDKLDNGAIYHGCVNAKCGVGFYIQPTENKKLT